MSLVTQTQKNNNQNRNIKSTWLSSGQISRPFLSFMNDFNSPRSDVFAMQHYKKENNLDIIYKRMDFSGDELLQENFTKASDGLTRQTLNHNLDIRPRIPIGKKHVVKMSQWDRKVLKCIQNYGRKKK